MRLTILLLLFPFSAFSAGKIINADIAASGTANIARNKLASGTNYAWCTNDSAGFQSETVVTASRAVATNSNGLPVASATTATELGYVNGVTSAIQAQIDGKQASGNYITALTGDVTASGPGSAAATLATVNASPGTYNIADVTVNGKGLVTSASAASTTGTGSVVLATAPALSNPVVGTQTQGDNSTKAASTAYVDTAVSGKASSTLANTHIYVGNVSNVATDVALSQDCSLANTGAITCTKTNNVSFAPSATTDTTNASNISTGSVALARITAISNNSVLANRSGSSASPVGVGVSSLLDAISSTQGSLLYRNAATWVNLGPGASNSVLTMNASANAPYWAAASGAISTASVRLDTFAGNGSPATAVPYFVNNSGSVTNLTVSNGSTSGALVTANVAGTFFANFYCLAANAADAFAGIVKNPADNGSTTVDALPNTVVVGYAASSESGSLGAANASWLGHLNSGDRLQPRTRGGTPATAQYCSFTVFQVTN